MAVTFLCNALMTWTSEWNFLPDVILASVSVSHRDSRSTCSSTDAAAAAGTLQEEHADDEGHMDNTSTEEHTLSSPMAATAGHNAATPELEEEERDDDVLGGIADNDLFLDEHTTGSDESTSVDNDSSDENARQHQQQIGIEYGSFISCIDFGDQLGALVMGWIVGAMNITRENDWHRLDDLIILCAFATAVGTVILVHVLL